MTDTSNAEPPSTSVPRVPADKILDTPFILMCITAAGFIGMLLVMSFHDVPAANKDLLNTLLGQLGIAFALVVGYYFGSSASSKAKDSTISNLSK